MKRTFLLKHEQKPNLFGVCHGVKMSVVRPTSKFCAVLFCAMLWLNPVGAQQLKKTLAENSNTELKMDKVPFALERQNSLSVGLDKVQEVRHDARFLNAREILKVKDFNAEDLAEEQKLEMVKDYMHQAFASVSKAGDATGLTHVFVGGSSLNNDMVKAIYVDGERTGLSLCQFPYGSSGTRLHPHWGTWNGSFYEGMWAAGNSVAGYYAYDPLTGEANNLTSAYLSGNQDGILSDACAYDYSSNKVYSLVNGYTEDYSAIESITFYSANKGTAVFEEAFSIEVSTSNIPVSMSIDKTGKFYLFCTDGKIYTVNKGEVYSLAEVGDTKQPTDLYSQSAAWDYRSDKMYLANISADGYGFMSVWNPDQKDTSIQLGNLMQLKGLASVFYVDANPVAVTDFGLVYKSSANRVEASFTVPSVDVNGDAITGLDTIEIFKVENGQLAGRVWVKQNPIPGESLTAAIENPGTSGSTVAYAVRVRNQNGKYSAFATNSVLLFNVTLPYSNGFEDADQTLTDATILAIDPQGQGGVERVNTDHYEGSYSYRISGSYMDDDNRQMVLQGIPVEKGGVYTVSFYGKTDVDEDGILFAFDGAAFRTYSSVYGDEWSPTELTYTATATGQMSLNLQGYGMGEGTQFFIDNLQVVQTSSPAVPAAMAINNVTAVPDGSLKATVNITLPNKTMGDETLSNIDSIVIFASTATTFSANLSKTVVKTGLTPGATQDFEITVSKAGQYYVRAMIYNEKGGCPYWSNYTNAAGTSYQKTPWIGSDLPSSVKVTATPQTDGTVALAWEEPKAAHEGYIGTVSYTLKSADGTQLYQGSDRTFTTAALELGMHAFTFELANEIETKSFNVNTLAGIKQGMIYSNVSTAGTYEGRVLNVSATADNSAFSQMLYPASGNAMYIDTLLLFTTAPATGEAKQYTKIYMGTTELTAFGGTQTSPARDFVEKDQLTEVFADTLRFKAGENTLRLPLKGFYYDGTKTLVIGVVKPMQERTTFAAAAYVAVSENNMLKYRAASTSVDFDTVSSYNNGYTGTPNGYSVSMAAMPGQDLKTMEVTVTEDGTATVMADAIVEITNEAGYTAGKNLKVRLTTGADGKVSFSYMPQGRFVVKVQKAGYIAATESVEVTSATASPIAVEVSLLKAKEVNISGVVEDKGGNKLVGVAVKAAGLADFSATTDNDGAFELQHVYGPGTYTLSFEKAGMNTYSMPLELGEKDTALAKVEMGYDIVGVPMASVAVQDGKAVVNWNRPSVSTTLSWVSTITQIRRLTINTKSAFKYAQRFLPEDLESLGLGKDPKALRLGFVVGSETAQYSIVLAADTTHEIYRQEVPAEKLVMGEWCNIDIPADHADIDITKELWLIVEVAEGEDQGYACATTTAGTVAEKGNLMYYNKKWYSITELFTNAPGNVLVRLLVEDASTLVDPANGYRLYRGKLQDEFEDYTLLTEQPAEVNTYTDADYSTLPFGQYNYAVVSDWYGDDLSDPTYTNTLNKDMEFTVTFKVTSNAGSAKDAAVYMVDTARTRDYEATVDAEGNATFAKKVWRDVYDFEITLPYHKTVTGILDLVKDTVVAIALEEIVLDPELTAAVEGKDVVVNYGVNLHNWNDDVESYTDFAIENIGDYILSEPVQKGGIQDMTWTNADKPQSWIVFNSSKTNPVLNLPAHSGEKMFAAFYNPKEQNNDYLIRPVSKGGGEFYFYCRAYAANYPESFEVVYSSTTSDLSAFKVVRAYNNVNITSWASAVVDIPEDARFVGIHCTSDDAFLFVVDDLAYYTEAPVKPIGYELYLDGTKVKDMPVDSLTYTFKNLSVGEHKVGVKALFASGASELVEKTVNVSNEAMPINLKAETSVGQAVLSWDMPEGFTPKSYKVFLGEEQKAENLTEKTYTFSELKNGRYTAAVVAVYETGESAKATVEFEIKGVDVEELGIKLCSRVYPNPNNGLFYLQAANKGLVEIYSLNGQKVRYLEIPGEGVYPIRLENCARGLYLLKFSSRDNTSLFKIVVR